MFSRGSSSGINYRRSDISMFTVDAPVREGEAILHSLGLQSGGSSSSVLECLTAVNSTQWHSHASSFSNQLSSSPLEVHSFSILPRSGTAANRRSDGQLAIDDILPGKELVVRFDRDWDPIINPILIVTYRCTPLTRCRLHHLPFVCHTYIIATR